MTEKILLIALGFFGGAIIYEPILINFVYMTNVGLFYDLILTKRSRRKLRHFFDYDLDKKETID